MNKTWDGKTQTERRKRRHRSLAERTALLGEYRASGLTQEKFATRTGINLGTLRAWIYRKQPPASDGRSHFVPVRVMDDVAPMTKSRGAVTVRWPQGIAVEIALDWDTRGALHLIRELLSPCLR